MNLPKFNAESALSKSTRSYRGSPRFGSFAQSGAVIQPSQDEAQGADDDDVDLQADDAGEAEGYDSEGYDSEEGSDDDNGEDAGEDTDEGSDEE